VYGNVEVLQSVVTSKYVLQSHSDVAARMHRFVVSDANLESNTYMHLTIYISTLLGAAPLSRLYTRLDGM